jgi:predicted metal-binding membrane protein
MSRASFHLRQPWVALSLAGLATAAAWVVTVRNAAGMSGAMPMPGGWSMSMAWMTMGHQSAVERAAMFIAMWTVMMVAMMLPSVMPVVMLHRRLLDARAGRGEAATGSNLLLLCGYFAVWAAFGGVAYLIGISVAAAVMRSVSLSRAVPMATGLALAVAGFYQLTRMKQLCLAHCRSPLEFFSHHRIRTPGDSLRFGVHHGAYCAACCWALMVIQLALGIMSLPLMVAVAGVIFLEKQWRYGQTVAVGVGIAALAGGALILLRALS